MSSLSPFLRQSGRALLPAALLVVPGMLAAADRQDPIDQADPSVAAEELNPGERSPNGRREPVLPETRPARGDNDVAQTVIAGAIRIEGATVLPASAFAGAIEPYLGRPLAPADLRALSGEIAAVARRAGFGLATAWIPSQSVERGVLRIVLDEGRIDAVEIDAPERVREALEARLSPLGNGQPLRTAELERQLLLAGDLAGVSLGRPRLVRRDGRNVLIVSARFDRARGRASLDNSGSDTVGPVRARLTLDINSLLTGGDRLSVGGVTTPLQPRELQYGQASYTVPVGRDGTELNVRGYASSSNAGGRLRDRDVEGLSTQIEAGVSHPLMRGRKASLWASATLALRDSRLDREGERIRDDRIVTATATLYANARLGGGRARVRLSYVQGLDWLGATRRGDRLASRRDGGGPFSAVNLWSSYERPLGRRFSFELRSEAQWASRPLLASEEMGLGGRQFLRGFDYREMSGDQGAAGSFELRYDLDDGLPRLVRRLQLYGFADAGWVGNLGTGTGGGWLASAGGGLRAFVDGGFEAGMELALPLTDGLFDDDPDPRFSFNLGSRF